jgi:hypothetical protein
MSSAEERPPSAGEGRPPTEEELRSAYEEQIKQVRVEHVLIEHVVTLANLGMRRTGLAPGTESERDPDQVRLAIDSIRALLPMLEQSAPQHVGQIREALSQLQLAFVKIGGEAPGDAAPDPEPQPGGRSQPEADPADPDKPGPAQRSGKLWVPGQ